MWNSANIGMHRNVFLFHKGYINQDFQKHIVKQSQIVATISSV